MTIQIIRDNLNIGLLLAGNHPYGLPLDDVLTQALGYIPGGPYPVGDRDRYISRLHQAQSVGLRKYALREPGYFTINAQPFGNIFLYKAVWYTWLNPNTGSTCTVLVANNDLEPMRRWRDKYLATRSQTTRSVRAADNLVKQDKAIANKDVRQVANIQAGMVDDGTLSEVITGLLGVPYVDVPTLMDLLARGNPYGSAQHQFTKQAQRLKKLEKRLAQQQTAIVKSLSGYLHIKQGLPSNVVQLALQDATHRLAKLP